MGNTKIYSSIFLNQKIYIIHYKSLQLNLTKNLFKNKINRVWMKPDKNKYMRNNLSNSYCILDSRKKIKTKNLIKQSQVSSTHKINLQVVWIKQIISFKKQETEWSSKIVTKSVKKLKILKRILNRWARS